VALVVLTVAGLLQTGCQSGFSGACGPNPCATGPCSYLKGLRERVFRPFSGLGGCCGSTIGAEAPLEMGPPAVVTPAPAVVPALPAAPAEVPPTDLSPAPLQERPPSAAPGSSTGSTGGKTSVGRASYEALRPTGPLSRHESSGLAPTMATTPEPPSRTAQGSLVSSAVSSDFSLENLPPLDIPTEVQRNALPDPAPAAVSFGSSAKPADARPAVAAAEKPSLPEPAQPASTEVSVAPGIRRFVALEPKLSGGSVPTEAGLDWLAEKGYKTLLDLRDSKQVDSTFLEAVTSRGLRYVALPIGLTQLDADHVSRFELELALSEARPLYFCDTDGTRAGALWYIRRLTVDKVDAQAARREAADLGLESEESLAAVSAFVQSVQAGLTPRPVKAPTPVKEAAPASGEPEKATPTPPAAEPAKVSPAPPAAESPTPTPPAPPQSQPQPLPGPAAAAPAGDKDLARLPYESLTNLDTRDLTAWRSYAALVFTSLGVPLAYWSRSALPALRIRSRASLPGPERKPQSLPN
jgi:protein tyrosine phosphatase (PTP) superfamily phosphohydrolase (DUF442 family)